MASVNGEDSGTSIQIGITELSPCAGVLLGVAIATERELLRALGTHRMAHAAGRTLFDHLTGSAAIAAAWRRSKTLQRAALFHSISGTSVYGDAAAADAGRPRIVAAIGRDAERLAWLFGALDRARFRDAIATMSHPEACAVAMRSGSLVALDAGDVRALVLLGIVNEIEQTCAIDGSPASWRARCPSLVAAVLRWPDCALPERVMRALGVSADVERATIAAYGRALATIDTDPAGATRALERAGACELYVAEPFVVLAELAMRRGDGAAADGFGAEARRRSSVWGTPWDKRSSDEGWKRRFGSGRRSKRELI